MADNETAAALYRERARTTELEGQVSRLTKAKEDAEEEARQFERENRQLRAQNNALLEQIERTEHEAAHD